MIKKVLIPTVISLCLFTQGLSAAVRISQIDSQSVLLNQNVKLYLSLTDKNGIPIPNVDKGDLKIFESGDNIHFKSVQPTTGLESGSNYEDGVSFLLLLDNSGSMYQTMEGEKAVSQKERRITHAKSAVRTFLSSITNPKDKVGLAVYNTYYTAFSDPQTDKQAVKRDLDKIRMPKNKDEFFSEIYGSLYKSTEAFKYVKGRKAIIILSDGENRSLYAKTKKAHRSFGKKVVRYQTPLQELLYDGISLYVINFGRKGAKKDKNLNKIAFKTGGATFDASNKKELEKVYLTIMDQILKEYVISYQATTIPAEKKYVRIKFNNGDQRSVTKRFYFSGSILGAPQKGNAFLSLIAIPLAVFLLWSIRKVKFERLRTTPAIEVLNAGDCSVSTQILELDQQQTIIGSGEDANMTIAGDGGIKSHHATIIFDDQKEQYTVIGDHNLMVNNKAVSNKVLESGDVINIDGVTMVFDHGSE